MPEFLEVIGEHNRRLQKRHHHHLIPDSSLWSCCDREMTFWHMWGVELSAAIVAVSLVVAFCVLMASHS